MICAKQDETIFPNDLSYRNISGFFPEELALIIKGGKNYYTLNSVEGIENNHYC